MIRMAFRFLLLCVLCSHGFGPSVVRAQAPVVPNPSANTQNDDDSAAGFRILDLIALDKDGRPVTDLRPEELLLFEDNSEQKIKSLSPAATEPLTIGLFFDVSGSRRSDTHVEDETRLTSEFLRAIWREGDAGFLMAFNDQALAVTQPTHKLEEIDKGFRQILETKPRGSTSLYDILCLVKPEHLNALPGRKVYVVFSDFEDNSSRNKAENVLDVARKGAVSIFPVILSEGLGGSHSKRSREQAFKIADECGGEVLIPESHKQLGQVFQRLTADVQSAYRIRYLPSLPVSQDKDKGGKLKLQSTRVGVRLLYPKG